MYGKSCHLQVMAERDGSAIVTAGIHALFHPIRFEKRISKVVDAERLRILRDSDLTTWSY